MKKVLFALLMVVVFAGMASATSYHTVKKGDTLWGISHKYYNTPVYYLLLAEVNRLKNTRTLKAGTELVIPRQSDMDAIRDEKDSYRREKMINDILGYNKETKVEPTKIPTRKDNKLSTVLEQPINLN